MDLAIDKLKEILSYVMSKNKQIVFVGLGNMYREDDYVGCYIVEQLKGVINKENFHFFNVGEVVENYINKILSVKPEYIFFVDAVKTKDVSEDILILTQQELQNYTFSTHNISLHTIINYILVRAQEEYNYTPEIYVLAVKVVGTQIKEGLSEHTKFVTDRFIEMFVNITKNLTHL